MLDDSQLDIQVLTILNRDISEIGLHEREFRLPFVRRGT
jgi:hypothetical protein